MQRNIFLILVNARKEKLTFAFAATQTTALSGRTSALPLRYKNNAKFLPYSVFVEWYRAVRWTVTSNQLIARRGHQGHQRGRCPSAYTLQGRNFALFLQRSPLRYINAKRVASSPDCESAVARVSEGNYELLLSGYHLGIITSFLHTLYYHATIWKSIEAPFSRSLSSCLVLYQFIYERQNCTHL